jgi:hypothetical protein
MSASIVESATFFAVFKALLDKGLISKREVIKYYWEMRKFIVNGASFEKSDKYILDELGIADQVYGELYELGLIKATPDEDLPLIISQLKTDEGKQELERRLKS